MVEIVCDDVVSWASGYTGPSFHAMLCDPPYELGFMGKKWDAQGVSFQPDTWAALSEHLHPGAMVLAFGGTRTWHRLACALEDAGLEIRDTVMWVYGSGFPKSTSISKQLDATERNHWLKIGKALDKELECSILEAWSAFCESAKSAGLSFRKSGTAIGESTPRSGSAPEHVLLSANPGRRYVDAIIADVRSNAVLPMFEENTSSALESAEATTGLLSVNASNADRSRESQEVSADTITSTALLDVRDLLDAGTADSLKAVEALKTWLGSKPSSRRADSGALCAALTDDLKRTILSQSETYRNADTTLQTECVSAISVTTTESTAASLISFTVDTLRREAADKAAGAEREVVGRKPVTRDLARNGRTGDEAISPIPVIGTEVDITAPATDAARAWSGYGTAFKPAWEPIIVARKPLDGTVAENVLKWGCGGINVDGCRVGTVDDVNPADFDDSRRSAPKFSGTYNSGKEGQYRARTGAVPNGRWPSNFIHDGSAELLELFPATKSGANPTRRGSPKFRTAYGVFEGQEECVATRGADSGSAARFFYCAKASRAEREAGMREAGMKGLNASPREYDRQVHGEIRCRNHHPCVKPLALTRYLATLILPPDCSAPRRLLVPFAGSGSEMIGAIQAGWEEVVGIEREAEYVEIARARVAHWATADGVPQRLRIQSEPPMERLL